MSTINITLSQFDSERDGSIGKAKRCSTSLTSASTIIGSVMNRLDGEIAASRNINNDLARVSKSIEEIEGRITDIRTFLLNAAQQYLAAQEKISKIHKEYDLPYKKTTWQKIKEGAIYVGKATVAIAASAVGIVAALATLGGAVGGVAVTFAAIGLIFALNDFITTTADKVFHQDFNILKSFFEGAGGFIGNLCGYEDLGKNIGNFLYNGLNITTAIYNLTKSFIKLKNAPSLFPNSKMIGKISDAESSIFGAIKKCGIGIKDKLVGIAKSSKGLSAIQKNLIMPIKDFTSVGINAVKSFLTSAVDGIKTIIKPGTDLVIGIAKKCEIIKNNTTYKFITDNISRVKNLTSANSVSGNVGIAKDLFNIISKNILGISKETVTTINEGFTATSALFKLGKSGKNTYKDIATYVY